MSVSEEDAQLEVTENGYDDSAHQGCYILRPPEKDAAEIDVRPKKRRKFAKLNRAETERESFPKLLVGAETEQSARLRGETFEQIWAIQQAKINNIIADSNSDSLEEIARFVRHAPKSDIDLKLPTGLVVVGKDRTAQQRLLHQWEIDKGTKASEQLIQLDYNQASNITSALKSIIRSTISSSVGQDGYIEFLSKHKRLIPINYDLGLLERFVAEKGVEKVVISILDVESFDIAVLSDLMAILASWTDRIPLVLLIGISTTVELFEAQLPNSAIRNLIPSVFDISKRTYDPMCQIFMETQHGPDVCLWLGPATASTLCEMTQDQGVTSETFGRTIKYAYMSHFFANALSPLLAPIKDFDDYTRSVLCEAIRNTSSFMEYVEALLTSSDQKPLKKEQASRLLENDEALLNKAVELVAEGQAKMRKHYEAFMGLVSINSILRNAATSVNEGSLSDGVGTTLGLPDDNLNAAINSLKGPAALDDVLDNLHIRDALANLSAQLFHDFVNYDMGEVTFPLIDTNAHKNIRRRARLLLDNSKKDLRQANDHQAEYDSIRKSFLTLVENALRSNFVDLTALPFNEIFVYNSKTPLSQAFAPTPRYAIERALDKPSDYLGCECCNDNGISSGPPTAILWRLWCEAGGIVNVRDLWEAFKNALLPYNEDDEDEEEEEVEKDGMTGRKALALFYRSVAELQMLGMLKQSKRKPGVECFAKIAWKGM